MSFPAGSPGQGPAAGQLRVLNDRYRLAHKLGDGGMGSVWLAEDTLLERSVALKELLQHAGVVNLAERRVRAVKEARAMARVRHPAIVPIHDVFFIEDNPWIVMEYISGRSLQDIIVRDGALDDLSVARIGLHVLRGLVAVHQANIVHRDVKPPNILVARDNSIFLVDFGIARITGDTSLTRQAIVGTPEYLAPERFKTGYKVGSPADIWALGVTFYYALSGRSPFHRDTDRWEATMMAILNDAPMPLSRSGRLAKITLQMLHKDPGRRATADQVLQVLERIVGSGPTAPVSLRLPETAGWPASPPGDVDDRKTRTRAEFESLSHEYPGQGGGSLPPGGEDLQARASGGAGHRGPEVDDARELLANMGADTGVAMLLGMPEAKAADILAGCPAKLCGELLQGIAVARPTVAVMIMQLLPSRTAGRAFAYLRPGTGASLVTLMTSAGAARVLDNADERTVASVIMEVAAPFSLTLLKSMYSRRRAAEVLTHVRPVTAAELLRSDIEFATAVLRYLSGPVRQQVSRHLTTRPVPAPAE